MDNVIPLNQAGAENLASRLRAQLEKTNHPLSNGAVAKLSGVPIDEITDHGEDSLVLQVTEIAMPLMTAVRNSQRITKAALKDESPKAHIQALKAIADIMNSAGVDYMFNLGVASKAERGGFDETADLPNPSA